MNRRRKAVRAALVCGALLVLVGLLGTLVASRLVNREALRQRIVTEIAQRFDAAVELRALQMSLWPLPHVTLRGLRLTTPGSIEVTVESAAIYPILRSLLRGEFDVGEIRLAQPEATVRLPSSAEADDAQSRIGSAGAIRELVATAMTAAAAPVPDLVVVVLNGALRLSRGRAPELVLSDIHLRSRLAAQQHEINLTCRSNLWDRLVVVGTLNPNTLIGKGRIEVTRLHPAAPAGDWRPDGEIHLGDTEVNLTMDVTTQGRNALHADVAGTAALFTLRRGSSRVAMKGNHLQASLGVNEDGLQLDVHDLQLDPPRLQLSGKLSMQGAAPALRVEVDAARVDVAAVRGAATALAGDSEISRAIFDVLRSGTVSHLGLQTHGAIWADLGNPDALVIHGHLAGGQVVVHDVPLELDEVDGDVAFASGVLTGDQVAARSGNIRARNGTVRVGLTSGTAELHVESMIQADVADVPPLLKRLVRDPTLASAVDRLNDIRGSVSGKLVRDATATAFAGTLSAANGLTVTMDIAQHDDELHVKSLRVRDARSDASFSLRLASHDAQLTFAGSLTQEAMNTLLPGHALSETVSGDLRARIALDDPARSTAVGQLTATRVIVPVGDGQLLHLDKVALDATEDTITIDAAIDIAPDEPLQLQGRWRRAADTYIADVDLVGTHVEWDHLQPLLLHGGSDDHAPTSSAWPQRLRGTLRAAVNSFTYRGLTWNPVRGAVSFTDSGPAITISDANVCGIATPGTMAITPRGIRLEFTPTATNQDLAATLTCLGVQHHAIAGTYRLTASIAAEGGAAEIASTLHGSLDVVATHGRVYRGSVLGKVLSTLSIATGSVGNLLEITQAGVSYETLHVSGDVRGSVLTVNQAVFDGPSVKMAGKGTMDVANQTIDLTLLVAPLKSVDSVVSHIPWLGEAVGGTLISIPVKVSGRLDDPSITPLLPSAVGSELVGLIKKTVGLPTRLIQPLLPGKETN